MSNPTAFVSYSWDSEKHKEWVRDLVAKLRHNGIDAKIDQWDARLGAPLPEFMERQIRENEFVLIVCTPKYKQRSEDRTGGVGYEGDIITGELLLRRNHLKFIPVLAAGQWPDSAPSWLAGKLGCDLSSPTHFESEYSKLWTTLSGKPPEAPPLGPLALLQQELAQNGSQLTREETEVLVASHAHGRLLLMYTDMFGTWLRADDRDFTDNNDPAVQAKFLDALDSLADRGLARRESESSFMLTGRGFDIARKLHKAKKPPLALNPGTSEPTAEAFGYYRHISRNGLGVERLIELPRIAYIGEVMKDYNFFAFRVVYQANQGQVDVGGFENPTAAQKEKESLVAAFQVWANRPL